jgi:anti-sigma regulatory factor (Ser/Thr protein kinase)
MMAGTGQLTTAPGGHTVHFYGSEGELADTVCRYLREGLERGEAVIVVATGAHRRAFEARLAAEGTDVAAARRASAFLAIDAADTMRRFLTGERPDAAGFELVIGGLIRQTVAAGRPVRVYGEMVALLWDTGHVNAAVEVEELWNELGLRVSFSLLCGYPAGLVSGDDHAAALAEVCGLHSAVAGGPAAAAADFLSRDLASQATRSFVNAYEAPRAARHFVAETLRPLADPVLADDAAIVATELATNAVVHARSGFSVTVSCSTTAVRISVRDTGALPLTDAGEQLAATAGHGLGLVESLASRWAAEPVQGGKGGKMVWAELRRRLAPTA